MESQERKEKIKLLQIKNRRNLIIKEMDKHNIQLSQDSFLDLDNTINLGYKAYALVHSFSDECRFEHDKELLIGELKKINFKDTLLDKEVIVFHTMQRDVGAICMKLRYIFDNLDYIFDFVGFTSGCMDFFIIDTDFEYGICLERWEYCDILVIWGID